MTEKSVETEIKEYVAAHYGWVTKIHADGMQGKSTLDLLGSVFGKPFYVEVKKPGGVASPMQNFLVNRAQRTGFISGIVDDLDDFVVLFYG